MEENLQGMLQREGGGEEGEREGGGKRERERERGGEEGEREPERER